MSVGKVIELTADSKTSFEDAIQHGITKAGESVKDLRSAWVKDQEVFIEDGKISGYRVHLKLTFVVK